MRLAGRVVLNDVSLALSPGHLVALVGPNGAGKTTLLRALAGLIPSDGEIEVGGEALSSLPLRERARRFAYLPQGHVVHWPLPARDIVALGRYPHGATDPARLSPRDAEAVLRAMQAVDVMEFASAASPNCPAASAAASRWRACWRWRRRSSWPTSRPPRSIRGTRSTS